jgi:predicted transposase YdaD
METITILLLGKGSIQELVTLPETQQYRLETLHHLAMLQVSLQIRQNKTSDLKEVIMNLAPVYEEWLAKTLAQGEAQGEQTKGIKIARRLLSKNMPLEEISEITELSIAEIQAIQAEKQA